MFIIYSHDKTDPESNMIKICTCETKDGANYVIDALVYRDTGGRKDKSGQYDYYIKEV